MAASLMAMATAMDCRQAHTQVRVTIHQGKGRCTCATGHCRRSGDAFKQGQALTYTRPQTKLLWLVRIGWSTTGGIVEEVHEHSNQRKQATTKGKR